jgi:hypothetical protein
VVHQVHQQIPIVKGFGERVWLTWQSFIGHSNKVLLPWHSFIGCNNKVLLTWHSFIGSTNKDSYPSMHPKQG